MASKILRRMRLHCAAALVAASALSPVSKAMGQLPTPPFMRPFAADKKGSVIETEFQIREHRNYYFMLVFDVKDMPTRSLVENLLSERYVDEKRQWQQREPRLLRLQIWEQVKGSERQVDDRQYRGYENSAAGSMFVEARFASAKLPPGRYRVRVESLSNIDGFAALPVQISFSIGYNPKSTPITQ